MSEESMRAEFEEWAIREYWLAECALARKKSGEYRDSRAAFAWEAWQASRAALVVELHRPPTLDDFYDIGQFAASRDMYYACRRAIESAGVRVKQ